MAFLLALRCATLNKAPHKLVLSADRGTSGTPPTSALPKASALFALATNNSQDCWLNASRQRGISRTQVPMLQGINRIGRIGTLLFSARVYYSLRGHQVGTLKSVSSILCHFAFVAAPPTECHSLLALSADRGTPGTPPCGVGSVFEIVKIQKPRDFDEMRENKKNHPAQCTGVHDGVYLLQLTKQIAKSHGF